LYLWQKRKEYTGEVEPIIGYQQGHSHKIKDLESFTEFVKK
jgi:hypothetical protein